MIIRTGDTFLDTRNILELLHQVQALKRQGLPIGGDLADWLSGRITADQLVDRIHDRAEA